MPPAPDARAAQGTAQPLDATRLQVQEQVGIVASAIGASVTE
jgi:hypothetical protein